MKKTRFAALLLSTLVPLASYAQSAPVNPFIPAKATDPAQYPDTVDSPSFEPTGSAPVNIEKESGSIYGQQAAEDPAAAAEAKKRREALRGTLEDPIFKAALPQVAPLSPAQIEELRRVKEGINRSYDLPNPPATSTVSIPVTTTPGVKPQSISLVAENSTALAFHDKTGSPWPILRVVLGSSAMYTVTPIDGVPNTLTITPVTRYGQSNLIVYLKGLSLPITLSLRTDTQLSYYSANLLVDAMGPNAALPSFVPAPEVADNDAMRLILDGAGYSDARITPMKVEGDTSTTAFTSNGAFYLRTPHMLITPGFEATISGVGIHVYKMTASPSIVLADSNGRPITVKPSADAVIAGALSRRQPLN